MGPADVTGRAIAATSSNPAAPANSRTVIFHNNGFVAAISLTFGVLALVIGPGAFFLTLNPLMRMHNFSIWPLYAALNWAFVMYCMFALGWSLLKLGWRMANFRAKLAADGVEFRLGPRKTPQLQYFPWDQIAQINQKCAPGSRYYSVVGKNHDSVEFTTYTFFRPQKLAQQISQRSHIAIANLPVWLNRVNPQDRRD